MQLGIGELGQESYLGGGSSPKLTSVVEVAHD
jgi:hypothetical protein